MSDELLTKVVKAWDSTSLEARLHDCRIMLRLYGYLTESESRRVRARIEKVLNKERKARKRKEVERG